MSDVEKAESHFSGVSILLPSWVFWKQQHFSNCHLSFGILVPIYGTFAPILLNMFCHLSLFELPLYLSPCASFPPPPFSP